MTLVIHFEIHAEEVPRAVAYYQAVFDWQVEDWSEFAGMPYFGVTTGPEDHPGINGAITQRRAPTCSGHGSAFGQLGLSAAWLVVTAGWSGHWTA